MVNEHIKIHSTSLVIRKYKFKPQCSRVHSIEGFSDIFNVLNLKLDSGCMVFIILFYIPYTITEASYMCKYLYICVYTYMHISILYIHKYVYICIFMYLECVFEHISICTYIYIYVALH